MNCAEKNIRAESWPKNRHQSSPPVGLYIFYEPSVDSSCCCIEHTMLSSY